MHLGVLDQSLWAATFSEDLILTFVLFFRQRARMYSCFTMLIGLDIVRTVILFLIHLFGTKSAYFYVYWTLALVDVILQIAVLYQVAARAFRPAGEWARDILHELVYLIVISSVVAVTLTWLPNPSVLMRLQIVLLKGNFCSALLLSELSVGILVISVRAGLPWTTHAARIIHGFVVYLLCTLSLETARTYFGMAQGSHVYQDLSRVRIVTYILCMAYWIVTLWRDAPPPHEMSDLMRQQLAAIHGAIAYKTTPRRIEVKP